MADINNSLNCLDLEFRHLTDEQTGKEMYALVRVSPRLGVRSSGFSH